MTSVINAAHRAPHAGRPDGLGVRLDERRGGEAGRPPRQPGRAAEPRPPDRRGRPRSGRRRRQPRLRADRVGPRRRLHGASSGRCATSSTGSTGATSSPSTRRAGSATTRSRTRPRRAAPTRSSSWATTTGPRSGSTAGSIDPLGGSGYDLDDTIRAYTARVPPSKLILGLPYYGRAWSTIDRRAASAEPERSRSTGRPTSVTYANAVGPREAVRPPLRRRRGRHLVRLPAQDLHRPLRLRDDLAPGLLRRRPVPPGELRPVVRSRLRGAGHLGPGLRRTRPELYGAISLKFLHDTTPPEAGIAILPARQGDAGFVVGWPRSTDPIRSYDVQVSVDGGPWRTWRSKTKATDGSARPERPRLRVPGPGDRRQGQRRALGRRQPADAPADARPRRVRRRSARRR